MEEQAKTAPLIINGISFTPREDCNYKIMDVRYGDEVYLYKNYAEVASIINTPEMWPKVFGNVPGLNKETAEYALWRHLILNDLWFIVYFVLGIQAANHPFVVNVCKMVENGPKTMTLDIWARGHWKTTIISIAETIQYHLKYPDRCSLILSYKKGLSEKILGSVKRAYELEFLRKLFPNELYENPSNESPSWALLNGLTIKRKATTKKEPTIYASGLVEGMAQGFHCERLVFDDFETEDMAESPDVLNAVFSKFNMAQYLHTKTENDVQRVIGTIYSHMGPIIRIKDIQKPDRTPLYYCRTIPGTVKGEFDGKPVFWSQEILDKEKMFPHYAMQVLCDPTPKELRKLNPEFLKEIEPEMIPKEIIKIMIIDPAGDNKDNKGDAWAVYVMGVEPKTDDAGASNVYIMSAIISPLGETEAIEEIVRMYIGHGIILKVGVEKAGLSTTELHIKNALAARGRRIDIDEGTLVILRPAGREKNKRILDYVSWPLDNGKIHISRSIPKAYRDRLTQEMDKFPYWKKDGLDGLAYGIEMQRNLNLQGYQQMHQYHYPQKPYVLPTIAG